MVRTLEKYLDLCEIDDQTLQNFYNNFHVICKCKFSNEFYF